MPILAPVIQDFIGNGITLPLTLINGRPKLETGVELIRASIRMILSWRYGTRFFLNEFGSQIERFIEEPNDEVLESILYTFIKEALGIWETRINLLSIELIRSNNYKIELRLNYLIINTQTPDSFVFPFYEKIIY